MVEVACGCMTRSHKRDHADHRQDEQTDDS